MNNLQEQTEVLNSVLEYIGKLSSGIEQVVGLYHGGSDTKANDIMIHVIDGLQWTMEAIQVIPDIVKGRIDITVINDHLNQIVTAFENMDYVLVSDILEYEVLPIVSDWKEKLGECLECA